MLRAGEGRPADLLRAADAAQYAAKRGGRGRVYVAGPTGAVEAARPRRRSSPGRSRALRDAPVLDLGRLLKETLGVLDGPLAGAPPAERLGGVLRRIGEATDALGWTVAFAPAGARARAARRRRPPRQRRRHARAAAPGSTAATCSRCGMAAGAAPARGCVVVERSDAQLTGLLRECMMRTSLDDAARADRLRARAARGSPRSAATRAPRDLRHVEPVLRLLAPEALRGLRDARHVRIGRDGRDVPAAS